MPLKEVRPYGRWPSDITARLIASDNIGLQELEVNPQSRAVYLLESRPNEQGRFVINHLDLERRSENIISDAKHDVRSRVHEYGGGAFTVAANGDIIYTDAATNAVVLVSNLNKHSSLVLPGDKSQRYACFNVHPQLPRFILAILETHFGDGAAVSNEIVVIDRKTHTVQILVSGADFYGYPRWSPDGRDICWIQWDHPDMPWTGSELFVGKILANAAGIELTNRTKIAGMPHNISITQPQWLDDDHLLYVDDRSGWWQFFQVCVNFDTGDLSHSIGSPRRIHLKGLEDAEFGARDTQLDSCTYAALRPNEIVATATRDGISTIVLIDIAGGTWVDLKLDIVEVPHKAIKSLSESEFVVIGATRKIPMAVYVVTICKVPHIHATTRLIRSSFRGELALDESDISIVENIHVPRQVGLNESNEVFAVYLRPKNSRYHGAPTIRPPLIVFMHGGPSSRVSPAFSWESQYWINRGYALISINYTGSTGYGRKFREALNGHWGAIEAEDAKLCVQYLVEQGEIDAARVGIYGRSAGGYSVLRALCTDPEIWTAGISHYGIADLEALAKVMHKFEKYYIQQLLFGMLEGRSLKSNTEDETSAFRERSPRFQAHRIRGKLLLLHGTDDPIVPLRQLEEMELAVREQLGREYVRRCVFAGEGHGWTKQATIQKAIEEETVFWAETLLQ